MQYDDAAYRQAIRRNAGWNFWVNVGDLSFVTLAGSFVFISTILPLYASYLTDSRILIGLIPAAYLVASHGPQLFMAARAEALGRKKPWVVRVSVFERVPWLILGLGHPAVAGGAGAFLLRLPGGHAAGGPGCGRGGQPRVARHAGQRRPPRSQGIDVRGSAAPSAG